MAPPPYGSGSADTFASLRRHGEYYLTGGDLFVLVTPIHFRIHRYFFERESEYFQKKLAGPMTPGNVRQGGSESTAIMIDDVTPDEFAKFLWVFYNPRYSLYEANLEDWKQILDLADRWTFPEVKALCIRQLQQPAIVMQDLEKICLYHRYSIDRNFLIPHYMSIILREDPPTLKEGEEMGMATTVATYTAREMVRAQGIQGASLEALVRRLFEVPDPVVETHDDTLVPRSPSYFQNGLPGRFDAPQTNGNGNTPTPLTVSTSKLNEPSNTTESNSAVPGANKSGFADEGKGINGFQAGIDDAPYSPLNRNTFNERGKIGNRRGGAVGRA